MAGDAYFDNVVLLCHFDGADGSTTIVDSSSYAIPFTSNNGCVLDTSQKVFGTASLKTPPGGSKNAKSNTFYDHWELDGGDFTIEAFVRFTSVPTGGAFEDFYFLTSTAANWSYHFYYSPSSGSLVFQWRASTVLVSGLWSPAANTDYYLVVKRSGTTLTIEANLVQIASATDSTDMRLFDGGFTMVLSDIFIASGATQYIDELRITKGVARDTSAIPTEAFPDFAEAVDPVVIPDDWASFPCRYLAEFATPSGDVTIPISSWQATLSAGTSNYAVCVIPAAAQHADTIDAATEFSIRWALLDASGAVAYQGIMLTAPVQTITYDRGPVNHTATVSGYWPGYTVVQNPDPIYDQTLVGIRSTSATDVRLRARCMIDFALRPAQRAWLDGFGRIVQQISYYASGAQAYMDVSLRPETFSASFAVEAAILETQLSLSFLDASVMAAATATASLDAEITVP